jgi:hypothetical protein
MTNQFVLYNTCIGGFSFNRKFILELFQRFPPHTPEGQVIFTERESEDCQHLLQWVRTPFFDDYHFLIEDEDDNEYESGNIINVKTEKIYFLNRYQDDQRANKDLIAFLFERAEKMTEEVFNSEYDKVLSKFLFESERDKIVTSDNTKKFTFQNWKESELLLSHMLTYDISDSGSDIQIEQVKPNLSWSIHEYDGAETVIVRFDYYKLITELVNELQINQIEPSSACSELLANVIRGKMTIDQLKEYEKS